LSSDPAMNWRCSALDKYTLISNSDAHSPAKLGREANIFDTEFIYKAIMQALKKKDKDKFLSTVEFFPEEGKYHFDGHRNCNVRFSPEETKAHNNLCPKCGRQLTVGVMNRVVELADRPDGFVPKDAVPFKSLVPLVEIIAEAKQRGVATKGVAEEYQQAVGHFGSEFEILLNADEAQLSACLPENTAEAIMKVRRGELSIEPGYDGEFGTVKIFTEEELKDRKKKQLELF
ncbi:MAG: DNA helicase UvrD, partial [Candidatus Omnitrophica bacterium]|nr:DNA helicase UvrD [Candidatus Omnitrophota bacterium]